MVGCERRRGGGERISVVLGEGRDGEGGEGGDVNGGCICLGNKVTGMVLGS